MGSSKDYLFPSVARYPPDAWACMTIARSLHICSYLAKLLSSAMPARLTQLLRSAKTFTASSATKHACLPYLVDCQARPKTQQEQLASAMLVQQQRAMQCLWHSIFGKQQHLQHRPYNLYKNKGADHVTPYAGVRWL